MNSICVNCFKLKNSKYNSKNIQTTCGHYNLYHHHCFMELSKDVKNENNDICCYHCWKINNEYNPIIIIEKNNKSQTFNKLRTLIDLFNKIGNSKLDKLIYIKKLLCLIDKNDKYFLVSEKFCRNLIFKLDEVLEVLRKNPEYDAGLNLKVQCYDLKRRFKKI